MRTRCNCYSKIEVSMPKRKSKGASRGGRKGGSGSRAVSRRERKAGNYIKPGDREFKDLSSQLGDKGLTLKDVLGDG